MNLDIQHEGMTIVTDGVLADYWLERREGGGWGRGREEESGVKWEGRRYGMGAVEGGVECGRGLGPREGRGSAWEVVLCPDPTLSRGKGSGNQ